MKGLTTSLGGASARLVSSARAVSLSRLEAGHRAVLDKTLAVRHALVARSPELAEKILEQIEHDVEDWSKEARESVRAAVRQVRTVIEFEKRFERREP